MRIISGKFRGRLLHGPPDLLTRPTSDRARESLFNVLENGLNIKWGGLQVLDLYAGTGALGIEALSRGAIYCCFIDNHPLAVKTIKKNVPDIFKYDLLSCDILSLKRNSGPPFDVVFLDPPYKKGYIEPTLSKLIAGDYLKEKTIVIIEISKEESAKITSDFSVIKEKIYGKTKIIFTTYLPSFNR